MGQNKNEVVPNNRLDRAYSRYVNEAYENKEFDLPEPELVGDTADHMDSEGALGFTIIRRQLGDAAVTEILSGNNHNNTSVNDGELILQETPEQNLVVEEGQPLKVTTDSDKLDTIPDNTVIPVSTLFETPEVKRVEKIARELMEGDDKE